MATEQPAYRTPSAFVSKVNQSDDAGLWQLFATDAIRGVVADLRVGQIVYPLRAACRTLFIPVKGEFLVEGFSPLFVGHGASEPAARENWLLAVHDAFQELLHKRPFEMTPNEKRTWAVLCSRIDVALHRNRTVIQVRQFGRVRYDMNPHPSRIEWENGSSDRVRIEQVATPDFITFKPGQPVEAVVARDPVDFRLLRIVHIARCSEPGRLSVGEEAELLARIGSAKLLPAAD